MKEERQEAMIGFLPRLIQKGDHEICIVAHQAELRCSIPGHTALQIAPIQTAHLNLPRSQSEEIVRTCGMRDPFGTAWGICVHLVRLPSAIAIVIEKFETLSVQKNLAGPVKIIKLEED